MTDNTDAIMHVHKNIDESKDSIEFGTPAKGGGIKVYGDFSKPEEFKAKIDAAIKVRQYAQAQIEVKVD